MTASRNAREGTSTSSIVGHGLQPARSLSFLFGRGAVDLIDCCRQGSVEFVIGHRASQVREERSREAGDHTVIAGQALARVRP